DYGNDNNCSTSAPNVHGRFLLPEIPEPGPDAHPIDKAMWAIADALNCPVSPDGTIYYLRFVGRRLPTACHRGRAVSRTFQPWPQLSTVHDLANRF
ncbi:hypothetical protein, partial [Mycolicibacter minnesotensis]